MDATSDGPIQVRIDETDELIVLCPGFDTDGDAVIAIEFDKQTRQWSLYHPLQGSSQTYMWRPEGGFMRVLGDMLPDGDALSVEALVVIGRLLNEANEAAGFRIGA